MGQQLTLQVKNNACRKEDDIVDNPNEGILNCECNHRNNKTKVLNFSVASSYQQCINSIVTISKRAIHLMSYETFDLYFNKKNQNI